MGKKQPSKFGDNVEEQYSPYDDVFVPVKNSSRDVVERIRESISTEHLDPTFTEAQISGALTRAYAKAAAEAEKDQRHPLSARFHQLLAEAGRMHDAKQEDYGLDNDPFHNVKASEDWGFPGWVGCMMRADDKMKRLKKFATKGNLRNESVKDSLMDLAVYSLIAIVLLEEESA